MSACAASRADVYIEREYVESAAQRPWVVAPVDLWGGPKVVDNEARAKLQEEIKRFLRAHDIKLADEDGFERGWRSGVQEVGGLYDASTGLLSNLKLEMAIQRAIQLTPRDVGLILFPRIVEMNVEINGQRAKWHGVKRTIPGYRLFDRYGGTFPALSLRIIAMDTRGHRIYDTMGGLVLHHELFIYAGTFKSRVRKDMFDPWRFVEQGVEVALEPLFEE